MSLGVFTTMSGEDNNNMFPLQLYLIDTFLGKKPWLNESSLCSFPEPWSPAALSATNPEAIKKNIAPVRRLLLYIGTYKNPEYGSLEVMEMGYNSLFIIYGWATFHLYPSTTPDVFIGKVVGTAANTLRRTGNQFIFQYDIHRSISRLTTSGLESRDPPVFVRQFHL